MEIYIQEVSSLQFIHRLPRARQSKLFSLVQAFEEVVGRAESLVLLQTPTVAWFSQFFVGKGACWSNGWNKWVEVKLCCADRVGTFAYAVQAKWERVESESEYLRIRYDDVLRPALKLLPPASPSFPQ